MTRTSVVKTPQKKLDALAVSIKQETTAADAAVESALAHYIRAGELLTEAKAACDHGQWLPWLGTNFAFTPRHAQNYMRLAANTKRISHLGSIDEALKQLAPPRTLVERYRDSGLEAAAMRARAEMDHLTDEDADAYELEAAAEQVTNTIRAMIEWGIANITDGDRELWWLHMAIYSLLGWPPRLNAEKISANGTIMDISDAEMFYAKVLEDITELGFSDFVVELNIVRATLKLLGVTATEVNHNTAAHAS